MWRTPNSSVIGRCHRLPEPPEGLAFALGLRARLAAARGGGAGGGAGETGGGGTKDCFKVDAPRMGLNLIFIKVSAAPTGALGPWKVEEP